MILQQTFHIYMSKKVVIVTGGAEALIKNISIPPTNWDKCVICQTDKEEQARYPANSTRSGISGNQFITC